MNTDIAINIPEIDTAPEPKSCVIRRPGCTNRYVYSTGYGIDDGRIDDMSDRKMIA